MAGPRERAAIYRLRRLAGVAGPAQRLGRRASHAQDIRFARHSFGRRLRSAVRAAASPLFHPALALVACGGHSGIWAALLFALVRDPDDPADFQTDPHLAPTVSGLAAGLACARLSTDDAVA